ncbi:MAG: undecaprenyl-phosphate glucose phosphotransferase [Steroidobacteraceae bacterium]|nr:undecaprenyl-phosphate glucose phosphotransferase [Steroidobacteraceae bacterium]
MHPTLFKRGVLVGLLTFFQAVGPGIVAISMLHGLAVYFGVSFEQPYLMLCVLILILMSAVMYQPPVMQNQVGVKSWPTVASILLRWLTLLLILLIIGYATKSSSFFSRRVLLTWAVLTPAPLIAFKLAASEVLRRVVASAANARTAVFAGYTESSVALAQRLRTNPEAGLRVAGYFDDRSALRLGVQDDGKLLGGLSDLAAYCRSHRIDVIFIALPMRHVQRVLDLLEDMRDTTASIYYVPDVFIFDLIQSRTGEILGVPVVSMCETPFVGHRGLVKRAMDVVIASITVVVLSPLLLLIGLLVKLSSPGPVIFRQRRYGLDGEEIRILKFRTMTVVEDGSLIRQATRDDERVTRVGRVLRRYSLDELPQLFNVLGGSMSLVGPRPHAVAHNEEYRKLIKGYMVRHKVPPGITGLAQVSGCRGETRTLEEMQARVEYDLDYLRQWTPMLDLSILCKTALLLLWDRKAY